MPNPKRRLCALVVDDNFAVAETFARLLNACGCEATFVTDATQALDEARRLKPQIAFLDIGMPRFNGYQLARALRKLFPPEELKLVAVSAYNALEYRKASRRAGFDAHVQKPADPTIIESIIKTVLPDA